MAHLGLESFSNCRNELYIDLYVIRCEHANIEDTEMLKLEIGMDTAIHFRKCLLRLLVKLSLPLSGRKYSSYLSSYCGPLSAIVSSSATVSNTYVPITHLVSFARSVEVVQTAMLTPAGRFAGSR